MHTQVDKVASVCTNAYSSEITGTRAAKFSANICIALRFILEFCHAFCRPAVHLNVSKCVSFSTDNASNCLLTAFQTLANFHGLQEIKNNSSTKQIVQLNFGCTLTVALSVLYVPNRHTYINLCISCICSTLNCAKLNWDVLDATKLGQLLASCIN